MNSSRLNRTYTLQECSRNMDKSGVTKSKSEDNKETVHDSLDSDSCKCQDTSCSQTQLKRLYKSENESEVFAPSNKRIKTVQRLTLAESEILKQTNDSGTYDSRVYGGTDGSEDNDGTVNSQDDNGSAYSPDDDDTDDSQDDNGTDNIQDDDGTDDSQDDNGTDDNQGDDGSDNRHKDICNKQDEADLFYGTHETQVSEGGEADLHKHLVGCKKNPGHRKFVPVNEFNISHLPEGLHDNDLVEYIKATADLTVRVHVKMTSTERPEFWPNTTVPYAFYNMRGSDVMRVGTGMVRSVNKWTEEYIKKWNKGTCRCHKCQHSDTPSKVWGQVGMITARHVVFDDLEARHTTCRLFFDGQDSPLVTLDGRMVYEASIEEDKCVLKCVTCDIDLLDKLDKMVGHWWDLWRKLFNKYKSSRGEVKLTFIVSHPHGCPKQISVGQWINRYVGDYDKYASSTNYTYTTCTCPGSSGAYVHSLGYHDNWSYAGHVHSGVNSMGNNFCAVGREVP